MAGKKVILVSLGIIAIGFFLLAIRRGNTKKNHGLGFTFRDGGERWLAFFKECKERFGVWAIPLYVLAHTLTLALCLPYAVFFEAGASLLFGFFPAVLCVFSAKVLAASLSFFIGRAFFRHSKSAMDWARKGNHFRLISRGVEQDGWRFVLLARFSPLPSYVINYSLAATQVGFFIDFLLPTIVGCLPMILQNTSIGSLAGTAVSNTTNLNKSNLSSYFFPLIGILSSILISFRIRKYSSELSVAKELASAATVTNDSSYGDTGCDSVTTDSSSNEGNIGLRKRN